MKQRHLPSLIIVNVYPERIKTGALERFRGSESIESRKIINFRFASNIDRLAEDEQELASSTGHRSKCLWIQYGG